MPIGFATLGNVISGSAIAKTYFAGDLAVEIENAPVNPVRYTVRFFRGDDHAINCTVTLNSVALDLSDVAITFSIKKNIQDDAVLIQKKNTEAGGGASEIEMTDAVNGEFSIYIETTDTESLDADGLFYFDIEMVKDSAKTTLIRSNILLLADITT
jgi:hypothetical protein